MRQVTVPGPDDLAAARAIVAEHLAPTPLVDAPALGALLKLESAQPTGAFKVRGGLAGLSRLPARAPARRKKGDCPLSCVTASTGNHALGIAWASARLGVGATVVVPETTSPAKLGRLRALGANLVVHGATYEDAEEHALGLPGHFVSPCNDTGVIAGQSTIGAEIGEVIHGPLCVVVPVGGGGLIGGTVLWAQQRPRTRVVGVEPAASPGMRLAVAAGEAVPFDERPTIADGAIGSIERGAVTIGLAARADDLVEIGEDEIHDAMRFLAGEHGLIVEGAAALPVAAIRTGRVAAQPGERVVAVITGRNVALDRFAEVVGSVRPRI